MGEFKDTSQFERAIFCLKFLQNRFIALATELFLRRFKREQSRSKVSIICTQLLSMIVQNGRPIFLTNW